jgi:hypothetical protein
MCYAPFWGGAGGCAHTAGAAYPQGLNQQLLQLIKHHSDIVAPSLRLGLASDPDDDICVRSFNLLVSLLNLAIKNKPHRKRWGLSEV